MASKVITVAEAAAEMTERCGYRPNIISDHSMRRSIFAGSAQHYATMGAYHAKEWRAETAKKNPDAWTVEYHANEMACKLECAYNYSRAFDFLQQGGW